MESSPTGVTLGTLIDEFGLEVIRGATDYRERLILTDDVNRSGLQLTGYFESFAYKRIQIIGKVENSYLGELTDLSRRSRFDTFFSYNIPALILARGLEPYPECLEMAEQYDRTILRTNELTTAFMNSLITSLRYHLAPRITRHGVLVEVNGEGVLIMGESGIGKSETAIELVKRGNLLIADDAVEIVRVGKNRLLASAPELIRHYIELRGIGVIDVSRLFGLSAVKDFANIDMVIDLEQWDDSAYYDRLGLDEEFIDLLGVQVPLMRVPVKPGRNLAVIIEVAAMNNRNKRMGFNSAAELARQIDEHIDQATGKSI